MISFADKVHVENILEKQKMLVSSILSCSHIIFKSSFFRVVKSQDCVLKRVNPFPSKPLVLPVCSTNLLKTLWEKEKLHVTSNFVCSLQAIWFARYKQFRLFPQCFFTCLANFCHFHQNENCRLQALSVWKSLKFCRLGKG